MILVDTSGLVANYNRVDRHRAAAHKVLQRPQARILSPLVLAELDYLLLSRVGRQAELAILDDVSSGAFQVAALGASDIAACRSIIARYADLDLGLTDASIVHLAFRYSCLDVLTLDERHFRAVRGPGEQPFRVLPADATSL